MLVSGVGLLTAALMTLFYPSPEMTETISTSITTGLVVYSIFHKRYQEFPSANDTVPERGFFN